MEMLENTIRATWKEYPAHDKFSFGLNPPFNKKILFSKPVGFVRQQHILALAILLLTFNVSAGNVGNDGDSDGIPDTQDNCPAIFNPGQLDSDGDGIGDSCENLPAPEPTPEPEPAPDTSPDPGPEPTPDPGPEPTPDPGPELTPDPGPELTPDPAPDPTPDPTPEPIQPPSEQAPEPTPEPSSQPETNNENLDVVDEDAIEAIKKRESKNLTRGVIISIGGVRTETKENALSSASENLSSQFSIGYDQFISDSIVIGGLISLSDSDLTFRNQTDSTETDTLSFFVFSSYAVTSAIDLSGYAGLGKHQINTMRFTEDSLLSGKTDGSNLYFGLSGSIRYLLENKLQISADLDVDYNKSTTDPYVESNSTASDGSSVEAFRRQANRDFTRLKIGTDVSKAFSHRVGVIVPKFGLRVVVDPDTSNEQIYGLAKLDTVLIKPGGLQFFTNITTTFANKIEHRLGVNFGARVEF